MITKHYDIAMTYEELAKAVFNCNRFEGPYNCANADVYDNAFVPKTNRLGRLIIKCIIDKILMDGDYSEIEINKILDIRIKINNLNSQEEAIEAINELIDFLNEQGY